MQSVKLLEQQLLDGGALTGTCHVISGSSIEQFPGQAINQSMINT